MQHRVLTAEDHAGVWQQDCWEANALRETAMQELQSAQELNAELEQKQLKLQAVWQVEKTRLLEEMKARREQLEKINQDQEARIAELTQEKRQMEMAMARTAQQQTEQHDQALAAYVQRKKELEAQVTAMQRQCSHLESELDRHTGLREARIRPDASLTSVLILGSDGQVRWYGSEFEALSKPDIHQMFRSADCRILTGRGISQAKLLKIASSQIHKEAANEEDEEQAQCRREMIQLLQEMEERQSRHEPSYCKGR